MEEIAELLREAREESGIELEEVSKDLEISEIILKNVEEGKIGSFKDIFTLKEYISSYAKYLGLDSEKIIDEFNEYLFEYTSRIPIKEIEKTIELNTKETEEEKIISPYTLNRPKNKKGIYIFIYILLLILVVLAIFWSVNQITVDKKSAYVVSYRK
ncbi:MAG: helix-turn-helix domain-containing protein [Bacilli bacterium]|nr:helix-turn-helix domain-containing protein [Bacilli bacterium]MBQ8902398.1 helix-turn-helix domain-containing protein [Bacilli bacterium]